MAFERGIGRTEIIIGVAIVAVVALVTIPLALNSSTKSHRDEVPLNVDSIRTAEITQQEAFEEYVSARPAPRTADEVDADAVPWRSTPGFDKLAWKPPTDDVYGSYTVSATRDGFKVTGTCDVDGDGERAVFEATHESNAIMITDEGVY